jgi:hypothetical protein
MENKFTITDQEKKLLEDYVEETGYGMDMWSKEETNTMSAIIRVLKQNKIIQDESK